MGEGDSFESDEDKEEDDADNDATELAREEEEAVVEATDTES